ncbi:MAG: hypothetical protein KF690_04650, partial [Bacteroidetes bacterium]|nr:hypothetical protein [Bacteroidota bacterium]
KTLTYLFCRNRIQDGNHYTLGHLESDKIQDYNYNTLLKLDGVTESQALVFFTFFYNKPQ